MKVREKTASHMDSADSKIVRGTQDSVDMKLRMRGESKTIEPIQTLMSFYVAIA